MFKYRMTDSAQKNVYGTATSFYRARRSWDVRVEGYINSDLSQCSGRTTMACLGRTIVMCSRGVCCEII